MTAKTKKNGYRNFFRHPFFLCALIFSAANSAADNKVVVATANQQPAEIIEQTTPADFSRLKYATPQLSLRLIDAIQQKMTLAASDWLQWEQKRLELLTELEDWQSIVDRIAETAKHFPAKQQTAIRLLKSRALLKLSKTDSIRRELRQLLWQSEELSPDDINAARQLIIRSYLAEGRSYDAQRAMLRYQQDYGDGDQSWKMLQARILLATKRYQQAVDLLAGEKEQSVQPLKLLARMRAGEESATFVYKHAVKIASKKQKNQSKASNNLKRQYWILAYVAASISNNKARQVIAIEQALQIKTSDSDDDLVAINAGLLWQLYQALAVDTTNKKQLLMGDDIGWFERAMADHKKQPVASRSILAYLGSHAAQPQQRLMSLEQFATQLEKKLPAGLYLLEQLFKVPEYFSSVDDMPVKLRFMLVDYALSRGKIKQAASLFAYLPEPPKGEKRLPWDMRRARVLVLGGQYQQGRDVLARVLKNETLDSDWLNRLMQIVFDLQKIDQHAIALELFDLLLEKYNNADLQRELIFWKAQSYQAMKDYPQSAHLYLQSALMIEEKQLDPWAQTARFKAGEVLLEAGLIADARQIFRFLLKNTKSEDRKSVIKQKLQQIWLLEGQAP